MSSNTRSLSIALIAAIVIFGGLLGALLFFLNREGGFGPEQVGPVVEEATPPAPAPAPKPAVPPQPLRPTSVGQVAVEVEVVDEAGALLRSARLLVSKAADGDRPGEIVWSSSSGGRRPASWGGKFQFPIEPGVYLAQAQAYGYQVETRKFQAQEEKPVKLQLRLVRGLSIAGTVYDQRKQPIGGALVRAFKELGEPGAGIVEQLIGMIDLPTMQREPVAEARSNADGTYQIDGLAESFYYSVHALADSFSPMERPHIKPSAQGVDFYLPEGSVFRGTVVDAGSGAPVASASVDVYPHVETQDIIKIVTVKARPPIASAAADGSGNFELRSLGSGIYHLVIGGPDYQSKGFQKEVIRPGENPARTYRLQPGLVIAGEVVDTEGQPVAAAEVRPIKLANPAERETPIFIKDGDDSIKTDEQGKFRFGNLESSKYNLLVSHNDFASQQVRDVVIGTQSLTVTLSRGGAISGHVIRKGDGQPIAGARITVQDLMDKRKEAITKDNGEYYVAGLNSKHGKRLVSVQAEGYARISNEQVQVEENQETKDINFELDAVAAVVGRVVDGAGKPVSAARVTAKRKSPAGFPMPIGSSQTSDDGSYEIRLEGGPDTTLVVMHSSYLETESQPFTVGSGESYKAEDLVVNTGGAIKGQVVDEQDTPVDGAEVAIREEGRTEWDLVKKATTDRRGYFLLRGLQPGVLDLQAKALQYLDAEMLAVKVEDGLITQNLKLVLKRGNRLAGIVLDEAGKAVQGAQVVVREYTQGVKEHRDQTGGDGGFDFPSLASKEDVELEVTHAEYGPYLNQKVKVGGESLEIKLPRLAGIEGAVQDAKGQPVAAFSIKVSRDGRGSADGDEAAGSAGGGRDIPVRTFTSADGRFSYGGLEPGRYTVHLSSMGYSATKLEGIVVKAGESTPLGQIVLEEGGVIDGSVVEASSGRPVAGATVQMVPASRVALSGGAKAALSEGLGTSQTTTDANGAFQFKNLNDQGKATLKVTHPSYISQDVTGIDLRDASSSRGLKIALEFGGEVSGVVVDLNNQPLDNAPVNLTAVGALANRPGVNRSARTSRDGHFSFTGLAPGQYKVAAHKLGRPSTAPLDVNVQAGAVSEVELVVE